MNKKGFLHYIIPIMFLIIAFIIFFMFVGYVIYNSNFIKTDYKECIREKAKNYCESINQEFSSFATIFGGIIYCKESLRDTKSQSYKLLDSEKKECKDNDKGGN